MNKSMMIGVIAGVGIAVAGGVAGFTLLGSTSQPDATESELLSAEDQAVEVAAHEDVHMADAATGSVAETVVTEECWDEEVTVQADPRDEHAIAGTAAGAVIGGALADRLGDDDDLVTAAGAAAGAFLGRKAQREYQENRTTTTTVRRCAPVQSE